MLSILRRPRRKWLPPLVALAILLPTWLLWREWKRQDSLSLKKRVEAQVAAIRNRVDAELDARKREIARCARRWEAWGSKNTKAFAQDLALTVEHLPGVSAMEWADELGTVRLAIPAGLNRKALGFNLSSDPIRGPTFARIAETSDVEMTSPTSLLQGGVGFLVMAPVFDRGKFSGAIIGVFRAPELFAAIERRVGLDGYRIAVRADAQEIYRSREPDPQWERKWAIGDRLPSPGGGWRLDVWPEKNEIARSSSPLPTAFLVFGTVLSLMAALLVSNSQGARPARRNRRETTQGGLSIADEGLEGVLAAAGVVAWEWDPTANRLLRTTLPSGPAPSWMRRKRVTSISW